MHSSNDTSAVDTLANFDTAVRAAKEELERDQHRFDALLSSVKSGEERLRASHRAAAEAADRLEMYENECNRIAHTNDQRREQIALHRAQLAVLRGPRKEIEEATEARQKEVAAVRRELVKGSAKATQDVLGQIRNHDPEELKARLAAKRREVAECEARVVKYRADLAALNAAAAAAAAASSPSKSGGAHADNDNDDNDNATHINGGGGGEEGANTNNSTTAQEDRRSLGLEVARLEALLTSKRAANAERLAALTATRDALRPRIRSFGQSMPLAEQLASAAENAYNELLEQHQGITCRQCGSEIGFEPIMMM